MLAGSIAGGEFSGGLGRRWQMLADSGQPGNGIEEGVSDVGQLDAVAHVAKQAFESVQRLDTFIDGGHRAQRCTCDGFWDAAQFSTAPTLMMAVAVPVPV